VRRFVAVCVAASFALSVVALCALCTDASADASAWTKPVSGPVVRPFEPPKSRFGAGHLGVDFRAAPGTLVRAVGPGTVVFAGVVARTLHVVIRHPNGWRTSYSFLASVRVQTGEEVGADVVGTTGGRGENHDGSVLHLGLRIGDAYVDPMQLFGPADLAAMVHLGPLRSETAPSALARSPDERTALAAGLPPDDYPLLGR
jgi:murein DD-endopeptidase MepM/ murein hydrolase activator NlpD